MKGTIIYVGAFDMPDKNSLAHRVLNNAKIFKELGYNVVFLGIDKDGGFEYKNIQGFDCYTRPYPKTSKQWLSYLCESSSFIDVANKYNDVKAVILYNYQAVSFYKITQYCQDNGIKVIADCADWYDAKGSSFCFYVIKMLDSYIRMHFIHPKTDGIIVISSYLEQYYKNHNHILRLPTLVDKQETKWDIQRKYSDKDKLLLAYAGSPGQTKDRLDIVVGAVSNKPNIRLIIAGINREQFVKTYGSQTIGDNIEFLGRISHKESLELICSADFSVFLREKDKMTMSGFPTKFAEAISSGTPVITTDTSDIKLYLKNGQNGFIVESLTIESLNIILDSNISFLKGLKNQVNTSLFDYRNYISQTEKWLNEFI